MTDAPDMIPTRLGALERHVCQSWRCTEIATWARWAGRCCYSHAIMAGWLPGVVRWPGAQMGLVA